MVAVHSSGLSAVAECYGLFFNKHCSVSLRLLRGVSFTNGILMKGITLLSMGWGTGSCLVNASQQNYSIFPEYQSLGSAFVRVTKRFDINLNVLKLWERRVCDHLPAHLQL